MEDTARGNELWSVLRKEIEEDDEEIGQIKQEGNAGGGGEEVKV